MSVHTTPQKALRTATAAHGARIAMGLALLSFVVMSCVAKPLHAQTTELRTQVTEVSADGAIKLKLPTGHHVQVGDAVTLSTEVPGIGRVNLQTRWRVTTVSGENATAMAEGQVSGQPKPGFTATIAASGANASPTAAQIADAAKAMLASYRTRAESGDTDAMLMLGEHYLGEFPLTGENTIPDPQQGLRWLTLAAERKNAAAACALASYYRQRKDIAQAMRSTRQAADGGDPVCMFALGGALLNGSGVAKNQIEGAAWIGKAAKAGLMPARIKDAELHMFGIGMPRDIQKAGEMFAYLANRSVPGAMFYLGALLLNSRPQQALEWNRKAAEAGHPMAMYQVATQYAKGLGVARNDVEARRWFAKGSQAGEPESMVSIAFMLEHGTGGPRNSREAARWAMKAFRGNALTADVILQRPRDWSADFWRELHRQLKSAGVYQGAISGSMNQGTMRAIEAVFKQGA